MLVSLSYLDKLRSTVRVLVLLVVYDGCVGYVLVSGSFILTGKAFLRGVNPGRFDSWIRSIDEGGGWSGEGGREGDSAGIEEEGCGATRVGRMLS